MDALHESLFHAIVNLRKLPMRMSAFFNMAPGEFFTLKRVYTQGQCGNEEEESGVSGLKRDGQMSMPAISQALGSLERRGYVTRSISGQDRRKITVSITKAGTAFYEQVEARMHEVMTATMEAFGERELEQLVSETRRLLATFEEVERNMPSEVEGEKKS